MHDVISIGSATKDVFLISPGFKLIRSKDFPTGFGECFAYGSKVELGDIYFDTGGGATNSAATFSNLGLKAAVVSKVGKDIYGLEILHTLSERGIAIANIATDRQHKTAYSTILVMPNGDRTILVYRGASANFSDQDFHWAKLKAKWFYLTSLAGNLGLLEKIFNFSKKNKIKISWNPGSDELKAGQAKLAKLMKQAYVFNVNREEAEKLTGKKEIRQIFGVINKLSPGFNIVTDGAKGAYLSDGMLIYHCQARPAAVVNTTGAGDAFGSAFCAGMILKNDWDYALRLAMLNATGVIQKMGAKNGLLKHLPRQSDLGKVKITILSSK